jgi:hypothetical protein
MGDICLPDSFHCSAKRIKVSLFRSAHSRVIPEPASCHISCTYLHASVCGPFVIPVLFTVPAFKQPSQAQSESL